MADSNGSSKPSAPSSTSAPLSMTFTTLLKKKPSAIIVPVQEEEKKPERDFITGIEGAKIKSVNPVVPKGPLVIPLIDAKVNRTYVRKPPKDLNDVPDENAIADRFETASAVKEDEAPPADEMAVDQPPKGSDDGEVKQETTTADGSAPPVKYGLNVIKKEKAEPAAAAVTEFAPGDVPLAMRNRPSELDAVADEDERFRLDVAARPDEADEAAYEAVPVEAFGEALLRGMGWEEGKGLGKNGTGMTTPIEFVKRPHRLGLGAVPKAPEKTKQKKFIKPGESRDPKPAMMVAPDKDGRQRSYRTLDEQLVPQKYKIVEPGASVAIVSGPHEGMLARVLAMTKDGQQVTVQLKNEEVLQVTRDQVELMSSLSSGHHQQQRGEDGESEDEEEEAEEDVKPSVAPPPPSSSSSKRSATEVTTRDDKKPRSSSSANGATASSSSKKTWLRPHIIVRVISKSFENGKYYQKKGRIEDVINGDECTLRIDNKLLDRVRERNVQTVVPKSGGRVLVLVGSQSGRVATVLETRDSKDVVVQMLDDMQIRTYSYDDVSEYQPD